MRSDQRLVYSASLIKGIPNPGSHEPIQIIQVSITFSDINLNLFVPSVNSRSFYIKGTVSVITCDPPCKDGNIRFTAIPLKALSDQV